MLNRILTESVRYQIRVHDAGLTVYDQYTTREMLSNILDLASARELCRTMNAHAVRNAMLWPTPEMMLAGGEDACHTWRLMVGAA